MTEESMKDLAKNITNAYFLSLNEIDKRRLHYGFDDNNNKSIEQEKFIKLYLQVYNRSLKEIIENELDTIQELENKQGYSK